MPKTRVVFQTTPVPVAPETEGPFAGCPQTKSMTYSRCFNIDRTKFSVLPPHNEITFYGEKYKIRSIGISHSEIGIVIFEEEMTKFRAKTKANGHRWKAGVENKVDGRRVVQAHAYRMSLN